MGYNKPEREKQGKREECMGETGGDDRRAVDTSVAGTPALPAETEIESKARCVEYGLTRSQKSRSNVAFSSVLSPHLYAFCLQFTCPLVSNSLIDPTLTSPRSHSSFFRLALLRSYSTTKRNSKPKPQPAPCDEATSSSRQAQSSIRRISTARTRQRTTTPDQRLPRTAVQTHVQVQDA